MAEGFITRKGGGSSWAKELADSGVMSVTRIIDADSYETLTVSGNVKRMVLMCTWNSLKSGFVYENGELHPIADAYPGWLVTTDEAAANSKGKMYTLVTKTNSAFTVKVCHGTSGYNYSFTYIYELA